MACYFSNQPFYFVEQLENGSLLITTDGVHSIDNPDVFIDMCDGVNLIMTRVKDGKMYAKDYASLKDEKIRRRKEAQHAEAEAKRNRILPLEEQERIQTLLRQVVDKYVSEPSREFMMREGYRYDCDGSKVKLHPNRGWLIHYQYRGWNPVSEAARAVIVFRRERGLPDYTFRPTDTEEFRERYCKSLESLERHIRYQQKREAEWKELVKLDVIPTTYRNISIVLRHLNEQNWGSWELPKMSIGYSCNQYDCDGKIATTMKLDQPIDITDYTDSPDSLPEMVSMFQVGAPHGHLMKYRRC